MKDFRKTKDELFICEECSRLFIKKEGLVKHINLKHENIKTYIEKWRKENGDGICETCGKETNLDRGEYRRFCNVKCVANNKELTLIKKKTKNKKYKNGYFDLEKYKKTCLKRYGCKHIMQNKKIKEKRKQTMKERFDDENYNNRKKSKKTCLEKYGVEIPLQNKDVYEKLKRTNLERYGVEHVSQNEEIHNKQQKMAFRKKQFRDTNIWYQGSYELDFLEKYYDKYPDILRGPRIKYIFEGNEHYYFSDFLIPSKNLVIECKNSYLAKRDKVKIKAKEKVTINEGFNYIMIVDKNYKKLNST